ncbi:unnamed protein product [Rotaria sordida]|uniref:Protein kinase domain-containing protein n=1 Tax=Rotaria sordida TaxID=392033 RepID=A0A814GXK7_9BILA|nr:unnamed protein product [Rotaria sordida]CAF0857947.1 unnamed protein product [Rotaria sordida]CAF1002672.1 unnamed protein product [Rotaria sordida]CAF1093358.1 unnamed protein product [Rotaria sordida]CAF1109631.1 unnamed protein product [Rotaria sordida]
MFRGNFDYPYYIHVLENYLLPAARRPIFSVRDRWYRILGVIGQGAQATVYRCEDQSATQYAVKVFYFSRVHRSERARRIKSFIKEARILKDLSRRSHHFIHLLDYEYKREGNIGYMIMELGESSLRQQLTGLPLKDPIRQVYWKQIVAILTALQDANVVHADIKPENLILVNNVLKLTDLGVSFRINAPIQTIQRSRIIGTIDYMAPEVFSHTIGFKSDVWSAGIILYEMTYGRPPFFGIQDRNLKVAIIASREPIRFPRRRNRYLIDCIQQCLQPIAEFRPSADQLAMHPYTGM